MRKLAKLREAEAKIEVVKKWTTPGHPASTSTTARHGRSGTCSRERRPQSSIALLERIKYISLEECLRLTPADVTS